MCKFYLQSSHCNATFITKKFSTFWVHVRNLDGFLKLVFVRPRPRCKSPYMYMIPRPRFKSPYMYMSPRLCFKSPYINLGVHTFLMSPYFFFIFINLCFRISQLFLWVHTFDLWVYIFYCCVYYLKYDCSLKLYFNDSKCKTKHFIFWNFWILKTSRFHMRETP